jgi:hypothetical protein
MRETVLDDQKSASKIASRISFSAPCTASLSRREFYKSMTTYADHRVWQDVYHATTPVRKDAYIKITLRDAAPVIQFKEK